MNSLGKIPFFSGLDETDLKQLKEDMIIKHYKQDNIVFYEGDQSRYLHILLDGSVKLYKTSPNGTQVFTHTLDAPSLIAEYTVFEQVKFPVTCEATKEGKIGLLHFERLHESIKNPVFSLELIRSLCKKMMILFTLVHKETILSSEAKVADLVSREPSVFSCLKNHEIAWILNMTPETLSRILSRFKKERIISFKEKRLMVLDQQILDKIIETNRFD